MKFPMSVRAHDMDVPKEHKGVWLGCSQRVKGARLMRIFSDGDVLKERKGA